MSSSAGNPRDVLYHLTVLANIGTVEHKRTDPPPATRVAATHSTTLERLSIRRFSGDGPSESADLGWKGNGVVSALFAQSRSVQTPSAL
jgi:hypothetical protein